MWTPSRRDLSDLAERLRDSCGDGCLIYAREPEHVNIFFVSDPGVAGVVTVPPGSSIGFAGIDFEEPEVVTWRSFNYPNFAAAMQVCVPWTREHGFRYWTASPRISPEMNGVLRGMGWSALLRLDLRESTILDDWLADHRSPYHDLFRKDMKESTYMKFLALSEADRLNVATEQLRQVESDYFRESLQATTAAPVAEGQEDVRAKRLADLEVSITKLQKIVTDLTPASAN